LNNNANGEKSLRFQGKSICMCIKFSLSTWWVRVRNGSVLLTNVMPMHGWVMTMRGFEQMRVITDSNLHILCCVCPLSCVSLWLDTNLYFLLPTTTSQILIIFFYNKVSSLLNFDLIQSIKRKYVFSLCFICFTFWGG
jgi:hypothetical protein